MNDVIVCLATYDVYNFNGWTFEWRRGRPISPWPLKLNGEPRACAGSKFYNDIEPFFKLNNIEQDKFMVQP